MPLNVDKLTVVSGILILLADSLAIMSLMTSDWIVTRYAGTTKLGLVKVCIEFEGQETECAAPNLPSEWTFTMVLITLGIVGTSVTSVMFVWTTWKPAYLIPARITSFFSMITFCLAALVFPFGFYIPDIGGEAYKLPPNAEVGYSYYLFFTALFFSTMSCSLSNLYMLHFNFV